MNDLTLQKAKALARRYRVVHACLTILAALLSLALAIWAAFVLHNRYWMMLLTLFLYLVLRRVITFITYQKYVMGCLTKELDPPLYRALLAEVRFAAYPGVDHLFAAHYHGEHQTVIDLCAVKMADPKCARFSLFYLLFLAPPTLSWATWTLWPKRWTASMPISPPVRTQTSNEPCTATWRIIVPLPRAITRPAATSYSPS